MVANLREEDMQIVVSEAGISKCWVQITSPYDHKRGYVIKHHMPRAAVTGNERLGVWNFVIERANGSYCTLHPDYNKGHVTYAQGVERQSPALPPNGRGGSWGRGMYKLFKTFKEI